MRHGPNKGASRKMILPKNARLGIVAPASPFKREGFEKGIAVLTGMGFEPVFDDALFERNGYLAGSDQHRAAQVNRFFANERIDALLCARGGYGSMRMLDFLDFGLITEHRKPFIGYSDITVLLSVLCGRCRVPVFHGPNVVGLGEANGHVLDSFKACLSGNMPEELFADNAMVVCPGEASGTLAGGNLTLLCHLVGTPYAPDFNKVILLLEDRGEAPYRIDRMLSQMKLAGCFDGVRGILLGSFQDCGGMDDITRVFADVFADAGIPILGGFPIGHGETNLTIPLGVPVRLETARKKLVFL